VEVRVEEITVGEAFQRCYPLNQCKEPSTTKTVVCANCKREIDKIIAINNRIGICTCGERIFDWRGTDKIGTPLAAEDQVLFEVVRIIINPFQPFSEEHCIVEASVMSTLENEIHELEKEADKLAKELKECLTNGWSDHEKTHWNDYLKCEVKPYWPTLYKFLTEHQEFIALSKIRKKDLLL